VKDADRVAALGASARCRAEQFTPERQRAGYLDAYARAMAFRQAGADQARLA
jgi:hypothetical protein